MKPRVLELLVAPLGLMLWLAAALPRSGAQTGAAADPPPPLGAAPASAVSPPDAKPARKPDAANDSLDPVNDGKPPKDIPMPLAIKSSTRQLKIPEVNTLGQILTLILAAKATRTDQQHVQMQEMKMDFYQPDGKEDFHIVLPTSTLNLQTHVITSQDPVTVRTADFDLTGERMEFNTLDRTGTLTGHVHMTIHNLKKVADVPTPTAHE